MATELKTETLIVLGVALAVVYMAKVAADKVRDLGNGVVDGVVHLWDAAKDAAVDAVHTVVQAEEDYRHKAEPQADGTLRNYTQEQYDKDLAATRRMEAGYHGM